VNDRTVRSDRQPQTEIEAWFEQQVSELRAQVKALREESAAQRQGLCALTQTNPEKGIDYDAMMAMGQLLKMLKSKTALINSGVWWTVGTLITAALSGVAGYFAAVFSRTPPPQ
jgi:hypothetical protein